MCNTADNHTHNPKPEHGRCRCGSGPISRRNATDLGAEADRCRCGSGPMSVRKWTDFAAEYDRSRAGVRPISMRNRTDVGAEYDRSRRWGRQAEPSSRITCPRASRTPGCPALPRAQPSYADAVTDNASQPRAVLNAPDAPGAAHPGLFISFEGGDGVGKTTQIRILAELLKEAGVECEATREPGGTDLGIEIRRLLLHGDDISPRAEALLYAADRAHHVATRIRPALERGAVVLTDRYLDSSVAYQGVARSLGVDDVRDLSLWATEGLLPDLTILLDAEPDIASRRTMARARRLPRRPARSVPRSCQGRARQVRRHRRRPARRGGGRRRLRCRPPPSCAPARERSRRRFQ